jgi:outer membrane protein
MRRRWLVGLILFGILSGGSALAQTPPAPLTLEESIKIALEQNLTVLSATEGVQASQFRQKAARTEFLAMWTGQYSYTWYNNPVSVGFGQVVGLGTTSGLGLTQNLYNFNTSLNQPIYTGGSISSNYRLEKLGVDISKATVDTAKLDVVVQARTGYFNILRAEKFLDVAKQAVKQFEAQLEVAKAFFDVGIVAKNDVLQAEVRLANAVQALVVAENNVATAKASFNTLLRRNIDTPLEVVDILQYKPFALKFEEAAGEALQQRPEIKAAGLSIDQAKEAVKIAKSAYFPTVSLAGNYVRTSDEFSLTGDVAGDRWTVQALATFNIFDWGKTYYRVGESKVKVSQAENSKAQLIEGITLDVKQAYLNMLQSEKNIGVAQKSIEQAEENLRMNEERYKYQVATQTDVLDAVVLLAQAQVNYYGALSDYNIAVAQLDRAMGKMYP